VAATPSELYRVIIDAWNARDAERMSAAFADDGTLIGFDGSIADTRAAIRDHLEPIFANHPTASYVAIEREARRLAPTVAVVRAIAGMIPPGGSDFKPELTTVHTLVAILDGAMPEARWKAATFQATPAAWHGREGDRAKVLDELRAARAAATPSAPARTAPR
jgi:uncharacterized protein (TIGR02246 family)